MSKKHKNWNFDSEITDDDISWMQKRDESVNERIKEKEIHFKKIVGKTLNQQHYINSIESNIITFCLGCAGTGKTYIACGVAAKLLFEKKIEKIVITRPTVECGKTLGHLPGSLKEKTDPFMMHLYDAFYDFFDKHTVEKYLAEEIIEVSALEYMRGKTFNNCVVILDEAQNVQYNQMKMFLTRIGENCRVVVSGDIAQSDLMKRDENDKPVQNSLSLVSERLTPHEDIGVVVMGPEDIQRNAIVKHVLLKLG